MYNKYLFSWLVVISYCAQLQIINIDEFSCTIDESVSKRSDVL